MSEPLEEPQPAYVENIVQPTDTLAGLGLRYGVSATQIRRCNRFSGSHIAHLRVLRIPLGAQQELSHEQTVLQQFRNVTGEQETESRVYLELTGYDLAAALQEWGSDEMWAIRNIKHRGTQREREDAHVDADDRNMEMNKLLNEKEYVEKDFDA